MSVAKITEISSQSDTSFDDAIKQGIARASKTVKNITGLWIKEQIAVVDNGAITSYRVLMKVTFVLK